MLSVNALECVRGERRLFSGVNFELKPQTLLEVRGANGSGKTSLLRLLCGLLAPASGCIAWNGGDIHASGEEYRAHIAYIGHLNAVKDELSGLENFLFSARIAGLVCDTASADQALHELGLSDFRHLPCKVLSQGQRRRVALARLYLSAYNLLTWTNYDKYQQDPEVASNSAGDAYINQRVVNLGIQIGFK